jgi:Arc/MetJ-type ribon-helix-helix transcriptional regulator
MSNQLPTGDVGSQKQVKVRADEELVERFDAHVEQSAEYSSRAEAMRAAMKRVLGSADETAAPRMPPTDDETLREGYMTLVGLANAEGVIPHDVATAELSATFGRSTAAVEQTIIKKLRNRGYIQQKTNFTSTRRSWKLRGVDDE